MAWRLNFYFTKIYSSYFFATLAIISLGSFLITLSETFNRNFHHINPSNGELVMLAAYNTPDHLQKIMPLIILLSGIIFFLHLARTQQLMIAQQTGVTLLNLLVTPLAFVTIVGITTVTILNPLAANLSERFNQFVHQQMDESESLLSVADTGIWLKQNIGDNTLLIQAKKFNSQDLTFSSVSIYTYQKGIFFSRLEAQTATIQGNSWSLQNVLSYDLGGYSQKISNMQLITNIDEEKILNSFTSVNAISIWKLSEFISTIENAGFDAKEHVIHFHSMLSTPIVMLAMFLLAGGICARAHHRKSPHLLVIFAISAGFGYFVFLTTFQSLGLFHEWPIVLTIWLPHLLFLTLVFTYILHQDSPNR